MSSYYKLLRNSILFVVRIDDQELADQRQTSSRYYQLSN